MTRCIPLRVQGRILRPFQVCYFLTGKAGCPAYVFNAYSHCLQVPGYRYFFFLSAFLPTFLPALLPAPPFGNGRRRLTLFWIVKPTGASSARAAFLCSGETVKNGADPFQRLRRTNPALRLPTPAKGQSGTTRPL